jgi:predicted phage tail protein
LLPLEEIYMAAGIVSPRRGYSIKKVMEMLRSELLSALSKEMRRASVMMALDAAGVSVDEVLRDAQARLDAIKSYEGEQKQSWEAEWVHKAEEHAQLKAELKQVRGRFMERMKQALDGIARDRARFGMWLTMVHEEAQSIAEAAELCRRVAPPVADHVAATADEEKETRVKVV